MVDLESKMLQNMPVQAIRKLRALLDPSLDLLDSLSEIGFQDPYEGWDYTGALTDIMAEMYLQGVRDGYDECNDAWNSDKEQSNGK